MREAIDLLVGELDGLMPRYGIVLGSGLGSLVDAVDVTLRLSYSKIPEFPVSAVSGHAGELVAGKLNGVPIIMLSGRIHYYEKADPSAMRVPLEVLKGLGVQRLILTNSAGSLREDLAPGSVMQLTDHISFSGLNPLIGEPSDARFVGLTNAYDKDLAEDMKAAAKKTGTPMGEGVYMWFSGPSFETPAEIRMARTMGADAVGMSTVPEVILARFLGMRVAAASVITNYGAGMTGGELSHEETKDMAPVGGARLATILKEMIASGAA